MYLRNNQIQAPSLCFYPEQEKDWTLFSGGRTSLTEMHRTQGRAGVRTVCRGGAGGHVCSLGAEASPSTCPTTIWALKSQNLPGPSLSGRSHGNRPAQDQRPVPSETAWPDRLTLRVTVHKHLSWAQGFKPGFRFILKYEQDSKDPQTSGGISTLTIGANANKQNKRQSSEDETMQE